MILKDEEKLFRDVRRDTKNEWNKLLDQNNRLESLTDCQSIGLIQAYKYIKNNAESQPKLLNIDYAITCYDRYGLNLMLIEQLANIKGITLLLLSVFFIFFYLSQNIFYNWYGHIYLPNFQSIKKNTALCSDKLLHNMILTTITVNTLDDFSISVAKYAVNLIKFYQSTVPRFNNLFIKCLVYL